MQNSGRALYHGAGQRAQPLQGEALALPLLGLALQLRPARTRVGIGDGLRSQGATTSASRPSVTVGALPLAVLVLPRLAARQHRNSLHGGV